MLRYMRILAYTTILLILAPMIVYAAIENGIELSDSEGVKIGEYEESTIILDTIFDEGFESVIFEIEPSSESEIITVMLYNGMFDYPADLDEYYVLADAEPANVKHMHGEDATEIEIDVEPGVTSVEIFGKIIKQDAEQDSITEPVPEEVIEIECDSGMMMVNGQCEIMEDTPEPPVCKAGTMFDGEKCVLESSEDTMTPIPVNTNNWNLSDTISFKGLIYGIVSAALIALAISLVLVAISKISRKK